MGKLVAVAVEAQKKYLLFDNNRQAYFCTGFFVIIGIGSIELPPQQTIIVETDNQCITSTDTE